MTDTRAGKHKVAPWNIAAEKKNKGTLAKEHGVSQAMVDEYVNQSGALYSIFMKIAVRSLVTEAGDVVLMPNILDVLPKDALPIGVHESYPVSGRKSRSRRTASAYD